MPQPQSHSRKKIQVSVHTGGCKPFAKECGKGQKFIKKVPIQWHYAAWAPTKVEQWSELARAKQVAGDYVGAARVFVVGAYTLWHRPELRHMALALKAMSGGASNWEAMGTSFEALKDLYFSKQQPPSPDAHLMLEHALMVLQGLMVLRPEKPAKAVPEPQQRRSVFEHINAFVLRWEPYEADERVRVEVFWPLLERMIAAEHAGAQEGWGIGMGLLHSSLKARHWIRVIEGVQALGRVRDKLGNQQFAVLQAFIEDVEHATRVPQEVLEAVRAVKMG